MVYRQKIPSPKKLAMAAGEKYYFTGKPCKNGHIAKRWTHNSCCVECVSEHACNWAKANKKRRSKWMADWRKNNPEIAKQQRDNANHKRRFRTVNSGHHSASDVAKILLMQKGKCAYCKVKLTSKNRHIDHIVPVALGGLNDRTNIQMLCKPCNLRKRAKDPIIFSRELGMLL